MKLIKKIIDIVTWFLIGLFFGYLKGLTKDLTEIKEGVVNKINKLLFGSSASDYWTGKKYKRTYRPYTTYTSYYDMKEQHKLRDPRNHVYYSLDYAEEVLRSMREYVSLYGAATIKDLKDILGSYQIVDYDSILFWNDLSNARIEEKKVENYYLINWPAFTPVGKD